MKSTPTSTRAARGTIIVDASTLIFLGAEVAPELRADGLHPTDYLEVLRFLGRNGYRILIPEVVSIEAAQVLATGQSLGNYFDSERKLTQKALKPFLRDAALPDGDPLKQIPGIRIVAGTGPARVDHYCTEMGNAVNHSNLRFTGRNTRTITATQQIRSHLVHLSKKDRTGFGDDAILSLLAREGGGNVAVLANDMGLLNRVNREFPNVHTSTSPQTMFSIGRAGLNGFIGFAAESSIEKIRRDHVQKTQSTQSTDDRYRKAHLQAHAADDTVFYRSLMQLAGDLEHAAAKAPAAPPPVAGERSARFTDKYARFKGIQPPKAPDGQAR